MNRNWNWMSQPAHGFAGLPVDTRLGCLEADIAIIGLHYQSPYPQQTHAEPNPQSNENAPDAIRRQSMIFRNHLHHYDFDFMGTLLDGHEIRIVDCGDVKVPSGDRAYKPERISVAIRTLLDRDVLPISIGTDEGNIIHVLRAYEKYRSLCVVHIDAHIDWRNERDGVKEGYSSVMRRASEMNWVQSMVQIGLRGIGSARQREVDDALSFGSVFIRARDVHLKGVGACLQKIPKADNYLITIDADALDTAIAPGVLYHSPGGLTFHETTDLLQGIAHKGKMVGFNVFEVRPERDINDITVSTAVQLIVHFFGILARTNQIGT